jgi:hypothetical protein
MIPVILQEDGLGCVRIQVKSLADKLCPSEIRDIKLKMVDTGLLVEGIPSLDIILNLCPYMAHSCSVLAPSEPAFGFYTVVIQGISESMAIFKNEKYKETLHKLVHILKINRFEVDFRNNERKLLPITTDLSELIKHIWKDWRALDNQEQMISMKLKEMKLEDSIRQLSLQDEEEENPVKTVPADQQTIKEQKNLNARAATVEAKSHE